MTNSVMLALGVELAVLVALIRTSSEISVISWGISLVLETFSGGDVKGALNEVPIYVTTSESVLRRQFLGSKPGSKFLERRHARPAMGREPILGWGPRSAKTVTVRVRCATNRVSLPLAEPVPTAREVGESLVIPAPIAGATVVCVKRRSFLSESQRE